MFPSGCPREQIDGIPVTMMDVGHAMVFMPAASLGVTGYETKPELDASSDLLARIESIRLEAGRRMGLERMKALLPLPTLIARPRSAIGTVTARNFLPHTLHSAHGVTQTICTSAACLVPGTVLEDVLRAGPRSNHVVIEHASGVIQADVEIEWDAAGQVTRIGVAVDRTCRKLFEGFVLVPSSIWDGRPGAN
jgi:4-oxalomesaconate tautomerase